MAFAILLKLLIALAAVLAAARLGGSPEKIAAAIITAWVATDAVYHLFAGPARFDRVDPVHVVLDSWELIAMTALALCANRLWPLFAAAAQLICVLGHVLFVLQPDSLHNAYLAMNQLPLVLQLLALVLGALAHRRRQRRLGSYRNWRLR